MACYGRTEGSRTTGSILRNLFMPESTASMRAEVTILDHDSRRSRGRLKEFEGFETLRFPQLRGKLPAHSKRASIRRSKNSQRARVPPIVRPMVSADSSSGKQQYANRAPWWFRNLSRTDTLVRSNLVSTSLTYDPRPGGSDETEERNGVEHSWPQPRDRLCLNQYCSAWMTTPTSCEP